MQNVADSTQRDIDTIVQTVELQGPKIQIVKEEGVRRTPNSKSVFFFIGLGVFLLFGLLRYYYEKYIRALFGTLSRSSLRRLSSNERLWQNLSVRLLFLIIYFLSSGFVLGKLIRYFNEPQLAGLNSWFLGVGIMFCLFLFKYILLQCVALVFRFKKVADAFFRHIIVINQIVGLALLPISGILLVAPDYLAFVVLIISVILVLMSMIFKFLVNTAYVRNLSKVNYMHFIVYLCTLEFIPLAVLARYAYDSFGV